MKPYNSLVSGAINRRNFLKTGVAAGATMAGLSLPSASFAGGKFAGRTLVFAGWGGAYQEAEKAGYCDPFSEKTGATVVQDGPVDYAKVRLMAESGKVDWDVVDVEGLFLYSAEKGVLEAIDKSIVDTSRIDPKFVHENGIGCIVWSWTLGYNKSTYSEDSRPRSWADFFDTKKFPGRRSMPANLTSQLEIALLADGVDPAKLYPLDVERALKKLGTIKDDLVFWATNSQSQQLLTDGEVGLGVINNGRIYDAVQKGANLGIEWNQNLMAVDYLIVPKGTKNLDMAMALIAEMTEPKNQALVANKMALSPTNPAAFKFIDSAVAPWLPTAPENAAKGVLINEEFWRDNMKSLNERWESWKVA